MTNQEVSVFRPREIPASNFVRNVGAAVFVCATVATFALPGSAAAASPGDLQCGTLGNSVVKQDGTILVSGSAAGLSGHSCSDANQQGILAQFKADGSFDTGFSDGGVKTWPHDILELMPSGESSAIVASGSSLAKVKADGELDPDFGTGGEVITPSPFSAASVQPDGKIVVAGGSDAEGITVARYKTNGQPDETFGGDGVAEPVVPPGFPFFSLTEIGFDGSNRILIAGANGPESGLVSGPATMRLLEEGTLDTTFGSTDTGFSAPNEGDELPGTPFFAPMALFVDADGKFRVYHSYFPGYSSSTTLGYPSDEDGVLIGETTSNPAYTRLVETPDGGIVSNYWDGRGSTPDFEVEKTGGDPDFKSRGLHLTPGGGNIDGITYVPEGNSLILTGYSTVLSCSPLCSSSKSMTIARINARTGKPDPSFGTRGSVLIPGNKCPYGAASPMIFAWTRCALKPPKVAARFRFIRGASRKPGLAGTVKLRGSQQLPVFQSTRLVVKLPDRLKLRARRAAKPVAAKVNIPPSDYFETADLKKLTRTRLAGRKVIVDFKSLQGLDDEKSIPADARNPAWVSIKFRMKRGVLKPVPRKLRRKSLNFRLAGSFSPNSSWYTPGTTRKVVKARALKPRRR